jgi:hypothetical protein
VVGPLARFLGGEVVRALEVDRVHALGLHELEHLECPRTFPLGRLEVGVVHDDVVVELVALDDLAPLDVPLAGRAEELLAEPGAADRVELVEGHRLRAGRDVELDRDRHQPESDDPGPDGRHGRLLDSAGFRPDRDARAEQS